jgi:hypothetical protein
MTVLTLTRLQLLVAMTVLMLSTVATAADVSECNMKKTADDKWECMAGYSGSALFCDRIKNWERRQHCVRAVIRKQREHR